MIPSFWPCTLLLLLLSEGAYNKNNRHVDSAQSTPAGSAQWTLRSKIIPDHLTALLHALIICGRVFPGEVFF